VVSVVVGQVFLVFKQIIFFGMHCFLVLHVFHLLAYTYSRLKCFKIFRPLQFRFFSHKFFGISRDECVVVLISGIVVVDVFVEVTCILVVAEVLEAVTNFLVDEESMTLFLVVELEIGVVLVDVAVVVGIGVVVVII
jgi:hypothetical protein